jgi:ABC-type transporter MlaC component
MSQKSIQLINTYIEEKYAKLLNSYREYIVRTLIDQATNGKNDVFINFPINVCLSFII